MAPPEPPLLTLNVGGQLFTALRATLRSRPDSLLSAMFSGEWEPTAVRDERGHPYIDRNPAHFPAILSFMRDGTAPVPDTSAQRQALHAEATYFGCWPLVEAIDAVEERHSRIEAAREQRLLAEARISSELVGLLDTANSQLEAATAAAEATRAELVSLAADMTAAQEEASTAGRQLEDALLAPAERLRHRRLLHTAAVRWHALQAQHAAAGEALEAARARQRTARATKLAAIQVSGPVRLGEEEADPPRRLQPRDPIPRVAPPANFEAWQAMEEQRQAAAAEAAGRRGAPLGAIFDFELDDEDDLWGRRRHEHPWRNGNGPAANFVADERGNAWAAPPRNWAWRREAAPAAANAEAPAPAPDNDLAMLQERLAQLARRRADDEDQEDPAPAANPLLQQMIQRRAERERERQEREGQMRLRMAQLRMGQAEGNQPRPAQGAEAPAAPPAAAVAAAPAAQAAPLAAGPPQAAGRAHRGWGPLPNADVMGIGQRGNALAVAPAAGEQEAAAARLAAVQAAAVQAVLIGEVEDVPPPALEAYEPPDLEPEEEEVEEAAAEPAPEPAEAPRALEQPEAAQPAQEPAALPPAQAGRHRRAGPQQEQRPMNRQQQLERGWGRPAAAKRDRPQAGAARRQAAERDAAA